MTTRLKISANHRYLVQDDEKETLFFYLGDTAWELFHGLTLEEAKEYLAVRAEQKFTVIQAVVLAEMDGLNEPNRNGDCPLHDNDPARPNEAYFAHVDAVLDAANALGLYIALLPTWGDKVNLKWGTGPVVFNPQNARVYGEWLGRRYANRERLIWMNGGDRPVETPEQAEIWRALAHGLKAGDNGTHLMTFHPMGGESSSKNFHADEWLDFDTLQSGHGRRGTDNAAMLDRDREMLPAKPYMDSEPNYENHSINWKSDGSRFRDDDVRISAYRSVLAGACGITYGCHDVWQFFDSARHPAVAFADTHWREALQFSGAWQMRHLRRLMEMLPLENAQPAQERILEGTDQSRIRVLTGAGFLLAYLPTGGTIKLHFDGLGFDQTGVHTHWFDPRTGLLLPGNHLVESWFRGEGMDNVSFDAPSEGRHNDWVMLLSDPNADIQSPESEL